MNKFHVFLFASALLSLPAAAQVTIDDTQSESTEKQFRDEVKERDTVSTEYENRASYRAERAMIRKERNYLEIAASLQGTLTSFNDPWVNTKGGDNSIAAIAQVHLLHNFKKDMFELETKFDAKIGYNRMKVEQENGDKGIWFKNQDELAVSVAPSYKFSKNWSFGSIIKFRTQFASGYKAREHQEATDRISTFMAPGYLDISVGFNYTCPKERFPIKINLSPIAMSATFVESSAVRDYFRGDGQASAYGVDIDKTSLYEGGSSIQIDFDRTFGKKGVVRYRTTLYSFYGWISDLSNKSKIDDYKAYRADYDKWVAAGRPDGLEPASKPYAEHVRPTVRWEHTINIKATKFLTTDFYFQMYYNKAQTSHIQTQTLLAVGLTYTFKNKDKK